MQNEFYIGQKVRTSKYGLEVGCGEYSPMIITGKACFPPFNGYFHVDCTDSDGVTETGLFKPEELEPLEDSIPHVVFDNIVKVL